MVEQSWILRGEAKRTTSRPFGLVTRPFEFPARPADDIDIDPLQGLNLTRRDVVPTLTATFTTIAFDDSSLQRFEART
jgi:hypothetical protein